MKKESAITHFGNQVKIATALGITEQAVSKWGAVVPWAAALELQHYTGGILRRDETLYENRRPKKNATRY